MYKSLVFGFSNHLVVFLWTVTCKCNKRAIVDIVSLAFVVHLNLPVNSKKAFVVIAFKLVKSPTQFPRVIFFFLHFARNQIV